MESVLSNLLRKMTLAIMVWGPLTFSVHLDENMSWLTGSRAILQYCIHAQYSTGPFKTTFPELITTLPQAGILTPAITGRISPTDTAQRSGQTGC